MNPTPAENVSVEEETPDEARLRQHDEAETLRKAEASVYEAQRRQDSADAETRRRAARDTHDRS